MDSKQTVQIFRACCGCGSSSDEADEEDDDISIQPLPLTHKKKSSILVFSLFRMSTSSTTPTIPTDPIHFKGELSYQYLEDESGRVPPCYSDKINYIPLETGFDDANSTTVWLHGRQSPYKAECLDLKLNHHNYGMLFCIRCQNKNDAVFNKIIWRRVVNKQFLHDHFKAQEHHHQSDALLQTIELEGDATEVPNCLPSTVILTLKKKNKHDWKIDRVDYRISLDGYNQFIKRYQDAS